MTEKYKLNGSFFLNSESVLVGSSAQIAIKPHLTINSMPADLKLLKNCKVIVQTSNYIDGVPITRKYDDLSFENNKLCTIPFQVPPNLGSIQVTLSC